MNEFRYVGEQWDPNAGLYYNRARWMNPGTGRFTSVDPWGGDPQTPLSLHRYAYANASPISYCDPSGRSALTAFLNFARRFLPDNLITAMAFGRFAHAQIEKDVIANQLPEAVPEYNVIGGRVDILNLPTLEIYEIKPDNDPFDLLTPEANAQKQIDSYIANNPGLTQGTAMLQGYIKNPGGIVGIHILYYSASPGIVLYEGGVNAEAIGAMVASYTIAYAIANSAYLVSMISLLPALAF